MPPKTSATRSSPTWMETWRNECGRYGRIPNGPAHFSNGAWSQAVVRSLTRPDRASGAGSDCSTVLAREGWERSSAHETNNSVVRLPASSPFTGLRADGRVISLLRQIGLE
jgi:hypothetical protein